MGTKSASKKRNFSEGLQDEDDDGSATTQDLKHKRQKRRKGNHGSEVLKTNVSNLKSRFGVDMSAWKDCFVPVPVLKALSELGFHSPTEIQKQALPFAIRDRADIIGAAETGSGKTLAFGIPVIHRILESRKHKEQMKEQASDELESHSGSDNNSEDEDPENNPLEALILTPTRELAVQVKNHLQAAAKYIDINVGIVIGGLSQQKQERLLKRCPEIVVATPGRLWEMLEQGEPHLSQVPDVKCLVIDEADRMVEKGHFEELTKLLKVMNSSGINQKRRQTFVFSATLTLIHAPPKRFLLKERKYRLSKKNKLGNLINLIGIKQNRKVVDITTKVATVETLTETRITCLLEEKDMYLYYFLHHFPGRTIVFCNSIDCVRRLKSLFTLLGFKPLPLHSSMHQKQRLKNLETFSKDQQSLLLATDVAARGLDIPGIDHVIHYQVPQTAESYVHRSGRTARAKKDGLSLLMISPQEVVQYRKHCKTLNRDHDLPAFPVDINVLKAVKERVDLAREIETQEHRYERLLAQNRWFVKAAKDLDVDIEEEDKLFHDVGDDQAKAARLKAIKVLKKQLDTMLKKPLSLQKFSGKYPTKMGHLPTTSIKYGEKAMSLVKKQNSEDVLINNDRMFKNKLSKKDARKKKKQQRRVEKIKRHKQS